MVGLFMKKARPIGLDIGSNSIKMIQLADVADKLQIIAADEKQIEFSKDKKIHRENTIKAIKEILIKGQFKGREVVTALSNNEAEIKNFKIPGIVDSKEIEKIIYEEAENKFGLTRSKYELDYIVAGHTRLGGEIKSEIILFCVKKEAIDEHIRLVESAGLIPVSIDTVPSALFRSYLRNLRRNEDGEQITLFVDFGNSFTTLAIGKGNGLSFIKQMPVAGAKLNQMVASKLDISVEEAGIMRARIVSGIDENYDKSTRQVIIDAMSSVIDQLTREISLCFNYFTVTFRGDRPDKMYCSGGEAYEQLLIDSLKKNLNIEVEMARPLKGFDSAIGYFENDRRRSWCEWTVPVGLSVKGIN